MLNFPNPSEGHAQGFFLRGAPAPQRPPEPSVLNRRLCALQSVMTEEVSLDPECEQVTC